MTYPSYVNIVTRTVLPVVPNNLFLHLCEALPQMGSDIHLSTNVQDYLHVY